MIQIAIAVLVKSMTLLADGGGQSVPIMTGKLTKMYTPYARKRATATTREWMQTYGTHTRRMTGCGGIRTLRNVAVGVSKLCNDPGVAESTCMEAPVF